MRNFLLAALLLVAAPVNAGDLGVFDVWMPGTQPKKAMTRSTSFEIIGSRVSFNNDLLEISISEETIDSAKKVSLVVLRRDCKSGDWRIFDF